MKKYISVLLTLILVLSMLTACGNTPATSTSTSASVSTSTSASVSVSEKPTADPEDSTAVVDPDDDFGFPDEWTNERPEGMAEDETVAAKVAAAFTENAPSGSSALAIAEAIGNAGVIDVSFETFEISEGFLNGFSENITGFKFGAGIAPFISGIPFIAYVFETDDTAALAKTLEEKADLRWNICTEADEIKILESGNYVFVVMAPWEF